MGSVAVMGRDSLLHRVSAELGNPGAVVTLVGEPGIGKTTVWVAALESRRPSWTWSVQCLEVEVALGLAVLADLFRALPDAAMAALPDPQRRAVEIVLCLKEEEGQGRVGQRLLGLTVLSALREMAKDGPVTLGVDDLQWCDPTSLEALTFAFHRLGDADVSVLATRRTRTDVRLPRSVDIVVGPLDRNATADLILSAAPATDPIRMRALLEACEGNPLFAKELAHQTAESGDAVVPLPSSLRQTLSGRLAPLTTTTRAALLDVAVRGAPRLAELGAEELDIALDEAFRRGLVRVDVGRVRFAHPLIAAAVMDSATPGQRRLAHRRAAKVCSDPVAAVLHRLEYEPPGEGLASDLDAAIDVALRRGDQMGARNLAERAAEVSSPAQRSRRLHRLMLLEGGLGNHARAAELAAELVEMPGTPDARADALTWLAWSIPDFDAGLAVLHEALAVPGTSASSREMILLDIATDRLFSEGRILDAISFLEDQRRSVPKPAEELPALIAELAWLKRLAGMAQEPLLSEAVKRLRAVMTAQDGIPLPHSDLTLGVPGAIALLDDRHGDAVAPLREATLAATRAGEVDVWVYYSGLLLLRQGRLADAHQSVEDALHWQGPSIVGYARLALIHSWAGDHQAAARAISAAEASAAARSRGPSGQVVPSIELHFAVGFDALVRRDYAEAWPPLRAAAELMEQAHYREPSHPPVLPAASETAAAVGELEQAVLWCERLERNAGLLQSRFGRAAARRSRGFIAEAIGEVDAAEAHFREAADSFTEIDVPLEQARTLFALGALQRRNGQRRLARETLTIAQTIFAECGAAGMVVATANELHRIGGRAVGDAALTASEQQVAECVARGISNAEAAQTLHLSIKTVESHLSRVYRKLNVSNRGGLAYALHTCSALRHESR